MEAVHTRFRVGGVEWILRVTPEQPGVHNWFQVTTNMLDRQLRMLYPESQTCKHLRTGRLAFAVEDRVLMPHAIIAHNMRGLGEQISMIPSAVYGSNRTQRYDDGLSSESSLAMSDGEEELRLPHLDVLIDVSGAMMAQRVMLPRGTVTLNNFYSPNTQNFDDIDVSCFSA